MDNQTGDNLPAVADPRSRVAAAGADLQQFEDQMLDVLGHLGLPRDDIIVSVRERQKLFNNTEDALELLDDAQRKQSTYIAKMIMAASVGLFDAALNYLWDETIKELRARVVAFDVTYFFDVAEQDPARRNSLTTPEDLVKIDDAKLMEAASRINLISDVGYKQLDHIRYMRNNASAAHPNQVALTGLKLAEWLETCIREVITLPRDTVAAQIGRLLHNVRSQRLPETELAIAASFFDQLHPVQADNLAAGLFGIYTRGDAIPDTLDNIRQLWPELWFHLGESARNDVGLKLARFRANAELDRATAARELLDLVDGTAYLPESDRAVELAEALDELIVAHEGFNNFYNEPPVAQRLSDLVGRFGKVPAQLRHRYVVELVYVFLTNGNGIAWNADPIYRQLIERFDGDQAGLALRSFADTRISSRLQFTLSREKWAQLLDLIDPKLTVRRDRTLLEAVHSFNGTPDQLIVDTAIKRQLGDLNADAGRAPQRRRRQST